MGYFTRKSLLLIRSLARTFILLIPFLISNITSAQTSNYPFKTNTKAPVNFTSSNNGDIFGTAKGFIENIGQYGQLFPQFPSLGKPRFAYEGFGMPVLFTSKGLIHLQRKIIGESEAEREREERREKKKGKEARVEEEIKAEDRSISMEWLGANPDPVIVTEGVEQGYHTYGALTQKARAFKKITYRELYPGIDLIYTAAPNSKLGFEYSLLVKPGADPALVSMRFGGDIKKLKLDKNGELVIKSDIDGISETIPVSYYGTQVMTGKTAEVITEYKISGNEIRFSFPAGYDSSRTFIIDPFITSTGTLTGVNAGKAKDVDFDYAGNIYVTGGGDGNIYKLAKYDAAGVLQWTFNGSMAIPAWNFGPYYGGSVVDKNSGNIYLGQGFNPATGYKVVRISTTGLYDNYTSTGNPNFNENWKMYWSCNNGSPQILVVGGGTSSNLNLGILAPPSTTITPINITGISGSVCQDMVDMVMDPATNDIYSLFASMFVTPVLNDKLYKNTEPYSAASIAWNVPSGYTVVQEAGNRPYLAMNFAPFNDNSANILAVNASYLYYWDGKSLKAFNKTNGSAVGTPLVTANAKLMQGGIIADACDNIFVGEGNGIIKVYKFNGSFFDDAAAADIPVPGFSGKSVYDLAYDESKKMIYASGDGFVGAFDISTYCPTTSYTVNVVPNCVTASATASVSPAPPPGSTVTYALYLGTTLLSTNTTGIFTGLDPNVTYTVVATINLACSGTQATTTFIVPGPTITASHTNTSCGANTGTITISGSGTAGPYTYNINGGAFQAGGNFTGLAAGIYTLIVKDAGGCPNDTTITILNSNGPIISFTQTNADCGTNNGTVTVNVSGGTAPYQYSINNGGNYQSGNFFTGLTGGQYILVVKDAAGCTNAAVVNISSSPSPSITAIPAAATCGSSNGTITAFGSGGTAPLQYSINGNTFQSSGSFINLVPGNYTVYVKDANGCIKTTNVTIANSPAPTVTASSTTALCNNVNGTITANGNGGIAPLQYSINAITFQTSNIFTGLAAGTYTVTVKDNTGCTNITTVVVSSTGGPSVTATSTVSACNSNTGSITATASAGVAPYQYSINGTTFQASNVFAGIGGGNYIVYVRDANGCVGTVSITVGNTASPSISASTTPTSCTNNTGTITITATGGTAPYQYSIDGSTYVAGNIFTGLGAGIYTVYVKDANGCIKTTVVSLLNVSGLSLTVSTIVSSCNVSNGSITATATGGAAPLQYSIDGVTYQSGNIFTGLGVGNYTVYVKDANGCIVTKPAVVTSVSGPTLTVTVQQQATCGSSSGVVIATGSGGLAPLTYNVDGGAYQSINVFINLSPAVHTFTVKDATGCISPSQSVTITNSGTGTAPTDVTFTIRDVMACTGGVGKIKNIKGVPSGGGNNYTFSLDGGAFTTANQFTNVPVGIHTVTAKNQNGCTVTRIAIIGTGTPATATATSTPSACGASTGTITITGVGVNTPYHASINNGVTWNTFFPPGANSFTFTGLAPGTYPIIMADDADFVAGTPDIPGACLTTIYVVVPSTGGPTISTTQINPTCTSNNGSITATGGSGVPPYTYNINGGAYFSSGQFNNLGPGNYAVTVKDASGCITGTNVVIANPSVPLVTAVLQSASCNLNNGSITVNVTGGTAPYQYSIDGTIFQPSNIFSGLASGSYTIYAADATGCYGTTTASITNTALPKVTAFTVAASCNNSDGIIVATGTSGTAPYTFSINGTVFQSSGTFTGLAAGFYTVYIQDARGCITTTGIVVGNTTGPSFTNTTSSTTCGNSNGSITITASGGSAPYQYSRDGILYQAGNVFSGLSAGTYVIYVKDASGCIAAKTVTVSNINGPQTLTAATVDAACGQGNGSITAAATGGTAPLQFSINGSTYQLSTLFSGLTAGNYTLYVKDANGCIRTLPVSLLDLPAPILDASSSPTSCGASDGTITAHATGGTLPLTYSKDGITFQSSNIFLGLAAGPYTITVKDARGCTSTFNITVGILGSPITPVFNPVAPVCAGGTLSALPTTSLNGITGTWSPALNNTGTTIYTFTPAAGQCALTATLTITVNPKPSPILIYHN